MMKKLFYIGLIAVVLLSCSKDDIPENNEMGTLIEFGELKTRTVEDVSDILEFGVFAEVNRGDNNSGMLEASQYSDLLFNERVYRANASSSWTYDSKRYWFKDRTFRFFALYPYQNKNWVRHATLTQNGEEYDGYQIAFEIPTDPNTGLANANTDLLTASRTVITEENQTSFETVNFTFRHVLSQINIKVAKNAINATNKVVVTSVSLGGIWKTGTLNTSHVSSEYKDNWDFSGATTASLSANGSWTLTTSGTEVMNSLLLMPQTIALQRIPVTISYQYYNNEADLTPQVTATAQAFIPVGEWEPAKIYTYTIVLAAQDNTIKIPTPAVSSWGAYQSGGTIIIQ
ncbi:MAG: fimbrillin family protein [Parabacteroides sp.]|nr:fimbrillin family protein [Parabacteroides sp.]